MRFWILRIRVMLGICLGLVLPQVTEALTNGVALTPPMGYNSWYQNGTYISEDLIKNIADQMATNGMKAAGYQYVNMDDGWAGFRDTNGVMVADTNTFPHGIKYLADYVHAKGLKLGIYTVFGPTTCGNLPGSYGHEVQDAQTYAEWGIDYLKYEGCSFPDPMPHQMEKAVQMRDALQATGRPIVFTMSTGSVEPWMMDVLNMWRATGDNVPHGWANFLKHLDFVARTPELAGPGHWNDPDVVDIGSGTTPEYKAMIAMYAIVAAPLLVPTIHPSYMEIYTNAEVLKVDQDPAGIQGVCVLTNGDLQVWSRPLSEGPYVRTVALLNRGTNTAQITANWSDLGFPAGLASVRDLWARAYEGNFTNSFSATVPGHAAKFLKINWGSPVQPPTAGTNYLSDLEWQSDTIWTVSPPGIQLDKSGAAQPMRLQGTVYSKGIGTIAYTRAEYFLGGVATRFQATVGVDDAAGPVFGSVVFRVYGDGVKIYDSGLMKNLSPLQTIDVDVTGRQRLSLEVTDAEDGGINDYGDWANARIVATGYAPSVPTGPATTSVGNQVNLTWYAVPGATSYTVKRSATSGGPYQVVGTVTNSSFNDINNSGSPVYYVISAVNAYGQSTDSVEAAATPPAYWENNNATTAQNWNVSENWTNTVSFPNRAYVEAVMHANIASNQTINLNQPVTIGSLTIGARDNSASFTILANGGSLTFNNGSIASILTQIATSKGDTLAAPIVLSNQLTINNLASSPLTIAGAISGIGPLFKTGPGSLWLGGSNSFTGPLTVVQGNLFVGNSSALGTSGAGLTIASSAALDLNGFDLGGEPITVSGAGSLLDGAIVNNPASGNPGTLRLVTLAGNTLLGGRGNWAIQGTNNSIPSGALSSGGQGFGFTKTSSNSISLNSITVDSSLGDIEVQQGVLSFGGATTSMGNPTRNLTVDSGATLVFAQTTTPWNKMFVLNGDGVTPTVVNTAGSNTIVGPVTLNGTCIFDAISGSLTLAGPLTGANSLLKRFAGALYLSGTNTFTGEIQVKEGMLAIQGSGSIASKNIVLNAGSILDVSHTSQNGITFGNEQTLRGPGTVKGNLTLTNGAALICSLESGTPVFSNALTLGFGSRCVVELSKLPTTNALVQVGGNLTYGGQLALNNLTTNSLVVGDVFKIFNASSYTGEFFNITPIVPGPGMLWDATALKSNGTIRVVAGTMPRITSFSMVGSNLVISGIDGRANSLFNVLSSTNAELPLYLWTKVTTNIFDANGHFSFTTAVNHNTPRMFYSLGFGLGYTIPQLRMASQLSDKVVLTAGGGPANAKFVLLSSTNVTLPISQWTRVTTNVLDANGNFSTTNTMDPGATRMFYLLQLPNN